MLFIVSYIFRQNVCIEKQTIGPEEQKNTTVKNDSEETEILQLPAQFQASISFSSCFESYDKYECITK